MKNIKTKIEFLKTTESEINSAVSAVNDNPVAQEFTRLIEQYTEYYQNVLHENSGNIPPALVLPRSGIAMERMSQQLVVKTVLVSMYDRFPSNLELYAKLENQALINAYENGFITPNEDGDLKPYMLWGDEFDINNISHIHTHCNGTGDGIYFAMKDGTYYSGYGDRLENVTPEDFDTVEN